MTLVSYPWMLDLLVGVILLACACIKGVKGIYKSLMPLAVIVASVICATFLSAILEMSRNVQSGNTQNLKSSAAPVRLPSAPAPTPGTSQAAVPAGCAYRS